MSFSTHPHEVTLHHSLEALPTDVEQLFAHAEQQQVESSLDWYRCLIRSVFPEPDITCLAVAWRDGRPMAALPLLTHSQWSGKRAEALSNYYTAVFAPILAENATSVDLVHIFKALQRKHGALGAVRFSPMDPESGGYQMLRNALRSVGWIPFEFFCFGNWFHPVTEDWPGYLKAREGAVRSTIKRMGKKFAADGGTLELVCGGARLEAALAAYQEVYSASWKVAEPYPTFIPNLAKACAHRGWLRLGIAWLEGRPIAAQLWIVAQGKANIYKLAYHEDYKGYAPGTLLTAMLTQHAIEQDHVQEIDYLIGDDAYKRAWMSLRRERWGIVAYDPRSASGLIGLGREIAGRILKHLKSRRRPIDVVA